MLRTTDGPIIGVLILLICLVLFLTLLILRIVLAKIGILQGFVSIKPLRLLFGMVGVSILIFILSLVILESISRYYISSLAENLRASTKIRIAYTFKNDAGKYITEDIIITDKGKIREISNLLIDDGPKLTSIKGEPSIPEEIVFHAYKGESETTSFRVIGSMLELSTQSRFKRYVYPDYHVLFKLREAMRASSVN